jgi:S1-C subfamily serine protease
VSPNSRAGAAGLRQGDLVLMVDGAPVATTAELDRQIGLSRGETVQLDILRESRPMRVLIRVR